MSSNKKVKSKLYFDILIIIFIYVPFPQKFQITPFPVFTNLKKGLIPVSANLPGIVNLL